MAADTGTDEAPTPTAASAPAPSSMASILGGLVPLDAESQDNLPISDGVDVGRGRGSEALPPALNSDTRITENIDLMKKYLPDLLDAARLPGAPDSYKRLVNYVKARLICNSLGYDNFGIAVCLSMVPWQSPEDRDVFIMTLTGEDVKGGEPSTFNPGSAVM